jgi:predicted dehydrogenase
MPIMICGLGSIGRRHMRNLLTLGQDELVLLRTGKSTLPDEDLASLPTERDLGEALAKWRPEAVVISNPTAFHMDVAIPAAQAGCHLMIEKPISHSLEGVSRLREAISDGSLRALVGFQFRYHPGLQTVKRLLNENAIGRPISARVHWGEYLPSWHPWEDYRLSYSARSEMGGGVVLTLCHPLDYLRWFFGEVEAVSAQIGTYGDLDIAVEDTAEITLGFQDHTLASVHLNYNQRPASHRLEIVGTLGTIRWDNADGAATWWTETDERWQVEPAPEGFERNKLFLDEMRNFLGVVAGAEDPVCTLEDGIRVLEIALAAKESAIRGRKIIVSEYACEHTD